MRIASLLAMSAALAGCVSYNVAPSDRVIPARLGQAVKIANFDLTPLEVIEDSRCPAGVQCIWEGRLRLRVRIDFDASVATRELTLGEAQMVGQGTLTLAETAPHPAEGETIYPEDYRLGFTYAPHIAR